LDREASRFIISPKEIVPHPVTLTKSFPPSKNYLYYYSLAYQYDQAGKFDKAEAAYAKALGLNPDFHEGRVEFAHFLLRQDKIQKAMELVEPFQQDTHTQFDFYLIRGMAHMLAKRFQQAIEELTAGNALYDSDVRLLNALGFCYSKTGQKKQAREALEASLRLNPEQKPIQHLLSEIDKAQKER
jgi:tetratricopeptide (TPR) repeat protein